MSSHQEIVWFTADLHFNHRMMVEKFRAHRFKTMDEMNETMITNWNSVVAKRHRVYCLGDMALGSPKDLRPILDRLNGRIFLIRGNHEHCAEHAINRDRFEWIRDYTTLTVEKQKIILCHYAFRVWNLSHYGSWNLYGHSHGSLPDDPHALAIDVGMDCWDFFPLSLERVKYIMAAKDYKPLDHHRPEDKEREQEEAARCSSVTE